MRTRRTGQQDDSIQVENKENAKMNGGKAKGKAKPRTASKGSKVHCLCRKSDDGSPMIRCEECKEWCVKASYFACSNGGLIFFPGITFAV